MSALCCPACRARLGADLACHACGAVYLRVDGLPDLAPHLAWTDAQFSAEQRLMNTRVFARVYDSPLWRPLHTRLASGRSLSAEVDALLSMRAAPPPRRAVDLACGTGVYTAAMAARWPGAEILGLDLSPPMLRAAVARLPRGSFARADLRRLPLANASVDHLNCAGALHLIDEIGAVWAEIARVLAPGGVLTGMVVGHPPGAPAALRRAVERRAAFHPFSEDSLAAALGAHGLAETEIQRRRAVLLFRAVQPGVRPR